MSPIMTSLDHLDLAIDRLESAVDAQLKKQAAERSRLGDELKTLRANHTALQSEARNISTRLDAAIGRLKTMLDA